MKRWRWAVVALLVAGLASLPTVAGALPTGDSELTADQLLERVRDSDTVGWSGFGTSRGTLVVPDVRELSDLPGLVGETTRTRAWWRGPADFRVDTLTLVGERDTVRDEVGTWTWDSADRRGVRVRGELDVRLPAAADLLAPVLGHRLAGTEQTTVTRLPSRRVAGRSAAGLRLVPQDPASTTVRAVDLWAEPQSGLVLRVEVRTSAASPSLTATLLDLRLSPPAGSLTDFPLPQQASLVAQDAPDIAALADRFAPYALPDRLAALPRRDRSSLSVGGGVGTYGDGFTALALVPLPRDLADRVIERVDPDDDDRAAVISTPLVNALVARDRGGRAYLLVGTVPQDRLAAALVQLRADPPPRVDR